MFRHPVGASLWCLLVLWGSSCGYVVPYLWMVRLIVSHGVLWVLMRRMLVSTPVDHEPEYFSSLASDPVAYPDALARAVRLRRAELRMSQDDVRHESGLSVTTIGKIEKGEPDLAVQRTTLRRLDAALQWPAGTAESWLAGRGGVVPTPATDVVSLVEELAPLVAAQLRGERMQSVVAVDGLPAEVVRAFEQLVTAVRNAIVHGALNATRCPCACRWVGTARPAPTPCRAPRRS